MTWVSTFWCVQNGSRPASTPSCTIERMMSGPSGATAPIRCVQERMMSQPEKFWYRVPSAVCTRRSKPMDSPR